MFFSGLFKKSVKKIDENQLPVHIGIIMDGNGRWAKRRGLSRNFGHREGSKNLKKIVRFCDSIGIKYLTVYAFSTENWKRPKDEVDTLMSLLLEYLKNAEKEMGEGKVRIRVIGDRKSLPAEIQQEIRRVEAVTRGYKGLTLNIAINYGGRDEIVNAVKSLTLEVVKGSIKPEDINIESINSKLYTVDTPEPDLIIRTSGEKRLSNFLLWQSAYSEFWFTDVLWPDMKEEHILEAIEDFRNRNRRFGGV